MSKAAKIKPKTTCCKDKPRCKRCPVTLKRLEAAGYARRTPKGNYVLLDVVPKQTLKLARAR